MDLDAYSAAHGAEWDRLARLGRQRTLDGAAADELIELYQEGATHLSTIRTTVGQSAHGDRLSLALSRARLRFTGTPADPLRSVGVFFGLVLVALTGWLVLDPLLAVIVAVNILWSGWRVIRDSVGGLMDHAVSADVEGEIRSIISAEATGALEVHDLRTRNAGRAVFIEFHLVVPG